MEYEGSYQQAPKPNYDCLIFDIDDTLYPKSSGLSKEVTKNIQEYMLQKLGIEEKKIPEMCLSLYQQYGTTMAGLRAFGYNFDCDDFHGFVHGRLPDEMLKPDPVLRSLLLSLPVPIMKRFKIDQKRRAMNVKLVLQLILLLCFIKAPSAVAAPSLAKPNCQAECGNVGIPYPFGIGKDCYNDTWYDITCNDSFHPPKPFLTRFNMEVLNVSLENYRGSSSQTVTVNSSIASNCQGDNLWTSINLRESPFNFSDSNKFMVLGCENALLTPQNGKILAGCTSICRNINMEGCYGIDCCQTSIPYGLDIYSVNYTTGYTSTATSCTYAFLLDPNYLASNFSTRSLTSIVKETEYAPVLLDWGMINPPLNPKLENGYTEYSCGVKGMMSTRVPTYTCNCGSIYEGNPFIPNGCQVVEACTQCKGDCYRSQEDNFVCYRRKPSSKGIILAVIISGGSLLLLLGGFWLYKVIRKIRKIKLKEKFFIRNGGLLLQQILSFSEGTIEKTKIFTSEELEKATDNFNQNRILGQGGQGTVYKGMLTDGRIVAIKKSNLVDESQIEQFIHEVVILSQINHRNVVNLFGCCLETNVPLLVFEFASNGNLFELIHDHEFPFSWEMRLQIATDVAGAVAFLHSMSYIPIYHRDIKSTNILLDDKYRAKVSDFGTSRSISIKQTHLTTVVIGTIGYLDPEYFQSGQFTEKSDVYSFGVVLAELLTGQKPISTIRSQEDKSLATYFILSLKENHLFDILDARVMKEGGKEEIKAVANIAKRCLNLNGKKRPTMKEVTMELEAIRSSPMPLNSQQNFEDDECIFELTGPMDGVSVSVSSCSDHTGASSLDVHPLLYNKV